MKNKCLNFLVIVVTFGDLLEAIRKYNTNILKTWLTENEADDITDGYGRSLLMWSAIHDNTEIQKLLLNAGADINKTDVDGFNALHLAAKNGNADTVKLLAAHMDLVDSVDKSGSTALYLAAENGHESCVIELLVRSNPCNYGSKKVPLLVAYEKGHINIFQTLLLSVLTTSASFVTNVDVAGATKDAVEFDFTPLLVSPIDTRLLSYPSQFDSKYSPEYNSIVLHPTTIAFLNLKERILRPFAIVVSFIYLLFAAALLGTAIGHLEDIDTLVKANETSLFDVETNLNVIPFWLIWSLFTIPATLVEVVQSRAYGFDYFKSVDNYIDIINLICYILLCPWLPISNHTRKATAIISIVSCSLMVVFWVGQMISSMARPSIIFKHTLARMITFTLAYIPLYIGFFIVCLYLDIPPSPGIDYVIIRSTYWLTIGIDVRLSNNSPYLGFAPIIFVMIIVWALAYVIGGIALTSHVNQTAIHQSEIATVMQKLKVLNDFEAFLKTIGLFTPYSLIHRGMEKIIVIDDVDNKITFKSQTWLGYSDVMHKSIKVFTRKQLGLSLKLQEQIKNLKLKMSTRNYPRTHIG